MTTFILVILIMALAIFTFNLENARKIKAARIKSILYDSDYEPKNSCNYLSDEERTIALIGQEEFNKMSKRIEDILKKHKDQKCLCLTLTCGPNTKEGDNELHHVLPGEEIRLVLCMEEGVDSIDAYHNGIRIGRFTLIESFIIHKLMKNNHIRGVYVGQQNCYCIEESQDIRLIVFYEPDGETHKPLITDNIFSNIKGKENFDFCDN